MKSRIITIRTAKATEHGRIMQYCQTHEHGNFAIRPSETLEAINQSGVYLVEADGELCGTSSSFILASPDRTRRWIEIGQSRITLNGLKIYEILLSIQVAEAILNHPSIEFVFAEVDEPNTKVSAMFSGRNFEQFEPCADLESACVGSLPPGKRPAALGYGFTWWRASKDRFHGFQKEVLGEVTRFTSRTGYEFSLVIDTPHVGLATPMRARSNGIEP